MIYKDITLIAVILVFIIDLSGIVSHVKRILGRSLHHSPDAISLKPLDCSLCMTFWVGIIYSSIMKEMSLEVFAFICIVAYLTQILSGVMRTLFNALALLLGKINNFLN